jgi:hypothetical protein
MSANKLAGFIRTDKDSFVTPNLYNHIDADKVEVHFENFRKNQQNKELIFFIKHDDDFYLPLWFEFRSINNNLLFLIKEYGINQFSVIKLILLSSLQKEEHYSCDIKAIVFETLNLPKHVIHLEGFEISEEDLILVKENP